MSKIISLKAREILESRGFPTVEVVLVTEEGEFSESSPAGTSCGEGEALELRDGGERLEGQGVLKAVDNVERVIAPAIVGQTLENPKSFDNLLIKLDGTVNKSKLGANAILATSLAIWRASAVASGTKLYQFIANQYRGELSPLRLRPCFNLLEGGEHAGNHLSVQEFLVIPQSHSFAEN
ncbi:MAG: phosphopyruvate hydratase, partial [Candidatus Pacebacteria bacterium]|nr:phosphopyruvate hydratase [Candidatus Paceibacterota bacterium]